MHRTSIIVLLVAIVAVTPQLAAAQEPLPEVGVDRFLESTTNAFELGVGFGYSQPFGDIRTGTAYSDFASAGVALEVDGGYRMGPELMVGGYATVGKYSAAEALQSGVYGSEVGVQGNWHWRPLRGLDPWIGLGTGVSGSWVTTGNDVTSRYGWEIVRAQIGLDIRTSARIAVSPVVGADVSVLLTESVGGSDFRSIPGRPTTTIFAGLLGRFDIAGDTTKTPRFVAGR